MSFGEIRSILQRDVINIFDLLLLIDSQEREQPEHWEYIYAHTLRNHKWSGRITELCHNELRWQQVGLDSHRSLVLANILATYMYQKWIPANVQDPTDLEQASKLVIEMIGLLQDDVDINELNTFISTKIWSEESSMLFRDSKLPLMMRGLSSLGKWLMAIVYVRLKPQELRSNLVELINERAHFNFEGSPLKLQGDYWREAKNDLREKVTREEIGKLVSKRFRSDRKSHCWMWLTHFDDFVRAMLVESVTKECKYALQSIRT